MQVRIVDGPDELARAGAEELARLAREAIAARGRFTVALAGGSTPGALYALLADPEQPFFAAIEWPEVLIFFGDERPVPPDHPDSNYRMAHETLLSKVPIPPGNVVRFRSEGEDPGLVAHHYEMLLRRSFALGPNDAPRLDLVLLGMGADGHTASWFPGSEVLHETVKLAAAPWVEKLKTLRYTLTPAVINRAAHVLFLVSGPGKAEVLRQVLEGERAPDRLPAQAVRPVPGELLWLVDREAGKLLRRGASVTDTR